MERDYDYAIEKLHKYAEENHPGKEIVSIYIPDDPEGMCKAELIDGTVFWAKV